VRLVVVLDSVGYRTFLKANIPNMKSVGEVHLAYSHGSWTLPSFASMFVGIFPACSIQNCYHRRLINPEPFFLRKNKAVVFTSNPWVEILAKSLGAKVIPIESTKDVLNHNVDGDIVFVHVMETHFIGDEPWSEEIQIKRLESIDKVIGRLIGKFNRVLITSDHGENFEGGAKHGNFNGIFRKYIFEVPLVGML